MEHSEDVNPRLFHCPTCGAALPAPDTASVRCEYCGSTVLVPPEYRNQKTSQASEDLPRVVVQFSQPAEPAFEPKRGVLGGIVGIVIVSGLVCALIGGALAASGALTTTAIFGSAMKSISTQAPASGPVEGPTRPINTPTSTPLPPISVDLLFGGEGTGPGQFDDPRYVAVDSQGDIFVGDYTDGRIQKFDPSGKFLQLINVEPDRNDNTLIRGMAADYSDHLYVARGGDLLIYKMSDGTPAGSIPGQFPNLIHDQAAVDPANNLYVVSTANGDSLLKYDPSANTLWTKEHVLEGIAPKNKPSDVTRIAVDGLGNVFILNRNGYEIYKFDTQGNFLDRFGSQGKELQQFNSPDPMAVDGKGRVFVLDSAQGYVLKVFDNNGSFLRALAWPDEITFPRSLLFDVDGSLYTVTNTSQVARMTIQPEALGD